MSKETESGMAGPGGERPREELGGRKSRWPRRRLLRWTLGLVPAVAGGGWATLKWLELEEASDARARAERWTQEAAWLCFARHPDATRMLDGALDAVRSYAPARLLYACWHMEQGEWKVARVKLSIPLLRDTPEARLLLELLEHRSQTPDWRHAFFEAWKTLGRPDFRKSTLLPEPLKEEHLLVFVKMDWERTSESQRFPLAVLALKELENRLDWGREQVRASTSAPLLMALREHLLALDTHMPQRQLLLPVEERLGQLAGSSPETLQLALLSFLTGRSPQAPFERRDLETLEKLVHLEWKQPSSERFFLEMRERLEGLLLLPHHHALLLATSAQGVSLGREMLRRARASKTHLNEDEQRWMGRLLWEVGARLREQRSRLELETGLRLQMFGSELTGHSPTRVDSIGLWGELGYWEKALERAAYNRWPLASLQEESCEPRARDEHTWLRAFEGQGELP
jgi:hypothetical protein